MKQKSTPPHGNTTLQSTLSDDKKLLQHITDLVDNRAEQNWRGVDLVLSRITRLGKLSSPPFNRGTLTQLRTCLTNTEAMLKIARVTIRVELAHGITLALANIRHNLA